MSIQRETIFTIKIKGATEFQHRYMRESIKVILSSFKVFYGLRNKRNVIEFNEKGGE